MVSPPSLFVLFSEKAKTLLWILAPELPPLTGQGRQSIPIFGLLDFLKKTGALGGCECRHMTVAPELLPLTVQGRQGFVIASLITLLKETVTFLGHF